MIKTKTVAPPTPDPAIEAARLREQRRVEAAQTDQTQAILSSETLKRLRRYGQARAVGGAKPVTPTSPGLPSGGTYSPGTFSGDPSMGAGSFYPAGPGYAGFAQY